MKFESYHKNLTGNAKYRHFQPKTQLRLKKFANAAIPKCVDMVIITDSCYKISLVCNSINLPKLKDYARNAEPFFEFTCYSKEEFINLIEDRELPEGSICVYNRKREKIEGILIA